MPLLCFAAFAGCDTEAVTLPPDFNEQKVKVINIDYRAPLGDFFALPGVQGGPNPTVVGDTQLLDQFLQAGVNVVRLPQGYLCEYTLSGIFPNTTANPDDPASYDFAAIDSALSGAVHLQGRIVFQAVFDIGLATCEADAQIDAKGKPPANPALWAKVVANTLRHFNKSKEDQGATEWVDADQKDFKVSYVEFIDDPLGRGGYESVDKVVDDFVLMAEAVKAVYPNAFDGPRVNVVGPSMTIDCPKDPEASCELDLTDHATFQFVDALITRGKIDLLDVLSFQTAVRSPRQNLEVAQAMRKSLVDRGLEAKVELWATRYAPDPDYNPEPENSLEVPAWSNFAGAFATATRIAWQGLVDQAIFYRGDRRHRSIDASDISIVEPSPLCGPKGDWRPAGFAWLPWRVFAAVSCPDDPDNPGAKVTCRNRLLVEAPPAADADGLQVLAIREDLKCADNLLEDCPKIFVLIANTNTHVGQTQVDFYGLSLGFEYTTPHELGHGERAPNLVFSTTAAVRYAVGIGHVGGLLFDPSVGSRQRTVPIDTTIHEIGLHIGSALYF